jgi:hypothetical protein
VAVGVQRDADLRVAEALLNDGSRWRRPSRIAESDSRASRWGLRRCAVRIDLPVKRGRDAAVGRQNDRRGPGHQHRPGPEDRERDLEVPSGGRPHHRGSATPAAVQDARGGVCSGSRRHATRRSSSSLRPARPRQAAGSKPLLASYSALFGRLRSRRAQSSVKRREWPRTCDGPADARSSLGGFGLPDKTIPIRENSMDFSGETKENAGRLFHCALVSQRIYWRKDEWLERSRRGL